MLYFPVYTKQVPVAVSCLLCRLLFAVLRDTLVMVMVMAMRDYGEVGGDCFVLAWLCASLCRCVLLTTGVLACTGLASFVSFVTV